MIFLTVGIHAPFDRLVQALDYYLGTGLIEEEIFGQIGNTAYKPCNFKATDLLDKKSFNQILNRASGVIGHADIDVIGPAIEYNKPLLVMPRLKMYREVVHDHQVEIAKKFEGLGYLLAAYNVDELITKIRMLENFVPQKRESQVDSVVNRITEFLKKNNGCTK